MTIQSYFTSNISLGYTLNIFNVRLITPDRRQAIIWTNTGLFLIEPLETNVSEILIEIYTFSFKKMHLKISFVKWQSFCLGLNVLRPDNG